MRYIVTTTQWQEQLPKGTPANLISVHYNLTVVKLESGETIEIRKPKHFLINEGMFNLNGPLQILWLNDNKNH